MNVNLGAAVSTIVVDEFDRTEWSMKIVFIDEWHKKNQGILRRNKKFRRSYTCKLLNYLLSRIFSYHGLLVVMYYDNKIRHLILNPITGVQVSSLLSNEVDSERGWKKLNYRLPTVCPSPIVKTDAIYWMVDEKHPANDGPVTCCGVYVIVFDIKKREKFHVVSHPGERCDSQILKEKHARMQILEKESVVSFCAITCHVEDLVKMQFWYLEDQYNWSQCSETIIVDDMGVRRFPFTDTMHFNIKVVGTVNGELIISWLWRGVFAYYLRLRTVRKLEFDNMTGSHVLIPNKTSFSFKGQSNISGRGGVINHSLRPGFVNESWDGVIPRECESNPSILRLSGGLKWVEAHEPLHKDIDVNNTCGIGPGMPFANTVLKKDPSIGVIGLVPCAVGGTSITEWAPGGFLYKNMIKRTKAATRGGGKIRALLWFQGESDTKTLEDAKMYKVRLERFFKHVRHDLELPNLTVIQVGIATALGPYMELVREAQREINIGNLKYVDAKGLQIGPDYTHLTTAAQIQLGQMLADAFLHLN
ncbi:hypothetical protein H5410_011089 [Solanum commersonii]|uniref:Sialate O-acetylesterase domain-containing protein n=1 Tax=Solanum commersonii TaxID=4109 RepID=A0A9J6AP73_SOLCO|nr:hypothetical protein H5410_011089 [Solanum commersonii]